MDPVHPGATLVQARHRCTHQLTVKQLMESCRDAAASSASGLGCCEPTSPPPCRRSDSGLPRDRRWWASTWERAWGGSICRPRPPSCSPSCALTISEMRRLPRRAAPLLPPLPPPSLLPLCLCCNPAAAPTAPGRAGCKSRPASTVPELAPLLRRSRCSCRCSLERRRRTSAAAATKPATAMAASAAGMATELRGRLQPTPSLRCGWAAAPC